MDLHLVDGEPPLGPWQRIPVADLAAQLGGRATASFTRPLLVGIDGRGGAGKSTLAAGLVAAVPGAVGVHGDDRAWHEPMFGWSRLLRDEVLVPLRCGRAVSCRPPAWEHHDRAGRISVEHTVPMVVVEGTGTTPAALADLYDATIWVQSDFAEAERRGLERDVADGTNGDAQEARAFWDEWMQAERAHLVADRPWERADLVVCGTPHLVSGGSEPGPGEVLLGRAR